MAMLASVCLLGGPAQALTQAEASAIATGETDARIAALNKAMATPTTRRPPSSRPWPTTP